MRTPERPASLACLTYRREHLECDGASPVCARCTAMSNTRICLASRRGLPTRQQRQSPSNDIALLTQDNSASVSLFADHINVISPALSARSNASALSTAAERSYLIQQYYSIFILQIASWYHVPTFTSSVIPKSSLSLSVSLGDILPRLGLCSPSPPLPNSWPHLQKLLVAFTTFSRLYC
jgi:hypothetical protein